MPGATASGRWSLSRSCLMHRALSLACCTLLVTVAGCGAKRAVPHPAIRHAATAIPASTSPLWVADQYFVASEFPDERAHITGEFARRFGTEPSLGSLLAPGATVALRPLAEHGDSAIVAATVTNPVSRRVAEWYTYLVRDAGTWKMYAIRTVQFSPRFYARLDSLAGGAHIADAPPGQRASMTLAAASDSALRAFVMAHEGLLDSLVAAYHAAPGAPAMLDVSDSTAVVTTIFRNPANSGCTFVRINGEGRRQVGALRADSGCRIPPMSPAGLVYTEHVQGGWYAYRAL